LPEKWQDHFIRNIFEIKLPRGKFKKIEYKAVENLEELEEALSLLHDTYLKTNLSNQNDLKYRLTKFNLLPTTTIFIAKYENKVIATITQVIDTSLGLPIDDFTNISDLRGTGKRISEITGLAVHKDWRSRSAGLFFSLTSVAVIYCKEKIKSDYLVIVTKASVRSFYRALFGFKNVSKKIERHSGINNNPSFAQYLDLNNLENDFRSIYKNKPFKKNMYLILKNFPWHKQCSIKELDYSVNVNNIFTYSGFESIFENELQKILKSLTISEIQYLKSVHSDLKYFDQCFKFKLFYKNERKHMRFIVNMNLKYNNKDFKIHEVSAGGFCAIGSITPKEIEGFIDLGNNSICYIKAVKRWFKSNRAGYELMAYDSEKWGKMIEYTTNEWQNNQNNHPFKVA